MYEGQHLARELRVERVCVLHRYCKIRTDMIACPNFGIIDSRNITFKKLFQKQIHSIALYIYKFTLHAVVVIYHIVDVC